MDGAKVCDFVYGMGNEVQISPLSRPSPLSNPPHINYVIALHHEIKNPGRSFLDQKMSNRRVSFYPFSFRSTHQDGRRSLGCRMTIRDLAVFRFFTLKYVREFGFLLCHNFYGLPQCSQILCAASYSADLNERVISILLFHVL